MTQKQLQVMIGLSVSCLALTIFSLPTLIFMITTAFFLWKYIEALVQKYRARGLIEICPESLKRYLLNRSMFDVVCSFWFDTSFIFLKRLFRLLLKPLVEPIERDNALQALNDMDPQARQMYLTKGVIRVMPEFCQTAFLGQHRANLVKPRDIVQHDLKSQIARGASSDENTDDKSNQGEGRLMRVNSESGIQRCVEERDSQWSRGVSGNALLPAHRKQTVVMHQLRRTKPQGVLPTIHKSLRMLKNIVEMQNLGGHIHRMSTANILKVMMVFWLALLIQVKFNKSSRKTVIKMLYALGGMVTVLGVVGTTGVLVYKHLKKRKNSQSFELQP